MLTQLRSGIGVGCATRAPYAETTDPRDRAPASDAPALLLLGASSAFRPLSSTHCW